MAELIEIVSVKGGKFHQPVNPSFEREDGWKPRLMWCGRSLEPHNYFATAADADRHTGGRLARFACLQCELARVNNRLVETVNQIVRDNPVERERAEKEPA